MRVPVNTFKIVCDGCGQTFHNGEDFTCYNDVPSEIENDARDSDWLVTADGHHYCDRCHTLNDNNDWETKDGKLYAWGGEPFNNGLVCMPSSRQ